jgi:hypothetical protein
LIHVVIKGNLLLLKNSSIFVFRAEFYQCCTPREVEFDRVLISSLKLATIEEECSDPYAAGMRYSLEATILSHIIAGQALLDVNYITRNIDDLCQDFSVNLPKYDELQ